MMNYGLALAAAETTVDIPVETIISYIKPELLVVSLVLYIVGIALKKAESVADNKIPFVLLAISVVLTTLWCVATTAVANAQEVCMLIFTILIQSVLITGVPVLVSQCIIQSKKKS